MYKIASYTRQIESVVLALLVSASVSAQTPKPAKPPAPGTPASFVARGAAEPVAACAAHATRFVTTPGPIKKFAFEDAQLTSAKVEEWNAPFKAGDKDRVAQLVTLRSLGEPRSGNERTYELKCGVNGSKVQGFSFRDVAVPIKTRS
jgi:hypothetical protein